MSISLRQIRYFVATAELGQISQAAVELSISQSAVTTAIRELERTVNLQLFHRSTNGMDLTPAGREFLFHAYEILQKVHEATHLTIPSGDVEGRLSVAATYTVMGYFLPDHLQRLRRSLPGLDIQLFELNREAIEEGLLDERYDIAVLLTSNVRNPQIASETMISSTRRLWVPSRHPFLQKARVGLSDVAKEPYIMLTVDEAANTSLGYWSATHYRPNVKLRTSSVEAVRSMVASGQGVAILSDMVYRPWSLEGQRLETIVLHEHIPAMNVGLAWVRKAKFNRPMEAFRAYFRQTFHIPQTRTSAPSTGPAQAAPYI
ncbi:LysR family transcriptional regulator [Chelativorans xinjiangense]|uniref:LysR family transcriptional regulator n=1 Tax=Chelativorans xinjiangense TaxID=2681485 RepID=UPI001358F7C5|nr:LysR family transcriptional regulator [Chelativorans xinjiangense]